MAADAYIKMAAAQLRDAAQELQDEARKAQVETYDVQRRLQKEASDADIEKVRLRAEAASISEEAERHLLEARIMEKERAANDKRNQVDQMGGSAAGTVNAKTSLADHLRGIASQLDSMASSAR